MLLALLRRLFQYRRLGSEFPPTICAIGVIMPRVTANKPRAPRGRTKQGGCDAGANGDPDLLLRRFASVLAAGDSAVTKVSAISVERRASQSDLKYSIKFNMEFTKPNKVSIHCFINGDDPIPLEVMVQSIKDMAVLSKCTVLLYVSGEIPKDFKDTLNNLNNADNMKVREDFYDAWRFAINEQPTRNSQPDSAHIQKVLSHADKFAAFKPASMSREQTLLIHMFSLFQNADSQDVSILLSSPHPPFKAFNGHTDDLMIIYFIFTGLNETPGGWKHFSESNTLNDFYELLGPRVHDAWTLSRLHWYNEESILVPLPLDVTDQAASNMQPYDKLSWVEHVRYQSAMDTFKTLIPNNSCHTFEVAKVIVEMINRFETNLPRPQPPATTRPQTATRRPQTATRRPETATRRPQLPATTRPQLPATTRPQLPATTRPQTATRRPQGPATPSAYVNYAHNSRMPLNSLADVPYRLNKNLRKWYI